MAPVSLPILIFVISLHGSAEQDNCDGVCGRRPLAPSHGGVTRIIGGTDVEPGTWPWMVSFCAVQQRRFSRFCGGSLISSRWVITATHCFLSNRNISELRAVMGITNFLDPGPGIQVLRLKRVINHKFYHQGNNNDITLVELDKPARCNDYVQPACLPDRSVDVPNLPYCYISGWGVVNVTTKRTSPILQEAKVNLIPTEICNSSKWLYRLVKSDCLCAGFEAGGVDTCQGDSGGPLMCREARSERFWVVGITSFGSGCAKAKRPGVYTSTQKFIDWITTQSGVNFYKPVHLPVALTAHTPEPITAASRPRPPPQPEPEPQSASPPQPPPPVSPGGPCGRRPRAPSHSSSVRTEGVAGVLPGTWPWLVSIQLPEGNGFRHWCAGSLINSRWVLSAAHCFVLKRYTKVEYWRVVAGVTKLSQPGPEAQVLSIKKLVEHENYNRMGHLNDIAMIELSQPVDYNNYIQPACFPDDSVAIPELSHCYFAGWTTTQDKKNLKPEILQEIQVNLLGVKVCNSSRWYSKRIKDYNLCAMAEKGGKESCLGDGGGPVMCRERRSERFWVVGINSWGGICTEARKPSVFISTQRFSSWIQWTIKGLPPPTVKPSTKPTLNWNPLGTKPISVPRPTGWFKPVSRPHLSWDRPNYVPLLPPQSQLPTRPPAASVNSGNPWLSRPPLKPWWAQPPKWHPFLSKQPAASPQYQNWTMGRPSSVIYRRPRPRRPPFQGQNQG